MTSRGGIVRNKPILITNIESDSFSIVKEIGYRCSYIEYPNGKVQLMLSLKSTKELSQGNYVVKIPNIPISDGYYGTVSGQASGSTNTFISIFIIANSNNITLNLHGILKSNLEINFQLDYYQK